MGLKSLVFFKYFAVGSVSQSIEWLGAIPLIALGLVAWIVAAVLYPVIFLISRNGTLGQKLAGTRLVRIGGRELGIANVLVRSLLFPFSIAFLGWLPVIFGFRPVHDLLAKTRLVQSH